MTTKLVFNGIPSELPNHPGIDSSVPHAPVRTPKLSRAEFTLAVRNALRYFPVKWHVTLAEEFAKELADYGHIYMYRFRPTEEICARPFAAYPSKSAAIMLMIQNNLDPKVAQFPHELITYGGNGSVFSNWAQYLLTMHYLSNMTEEQTLVMMSGHPSGLFPSGSEHPRVIVTNGMVVPNYSSRADYDRMYAVGVSQYGQMTAGSYCYIGPQGIVHGTTITVLNAGRKYLGSADLAGKVFVTSGLGGMSGAQAKAAVIAGAIGVIAEVNPVALKKRHAQGWVQEYVEDLDLCVERIRRARQEKKPLSLAYLGNVVDLWEKLAQSDVPIELGSDQTSLHNPFGGGYYPVQLSFEEAGKVMVQDPAKFKELVQESLRRHAAAVNTLCAKGMHFWDYGNAFLLEASRAQAEVMNSDRTGFRYPSYVQDIMGDIFSLGFGPFRWVCTSGDAQDLIATDRIAESIIQSLSQTADQRVQQQYGDNLLWIQQADSHQLVVGSQARILYTDRKGRVALAEAFNAAVLAGKLKAPVVISRDHHDVSGADSPFRETSNVTDGSMFCADMAVHTALGNCARGATWVALHNGGGVGWGEVINCGFGLVLDGRETTTARAQKMLAWDVDSGIARRAWGRNDNAIWSAERAMEQDPLLKITIPSLCDDDLLEKALNSNFKA